MKTKRGMWNFVELPHIPKISRAERRYWKDYLGRVVKEGIEIEFNLQERKGAGCPGSVERICVCTDFEKCTNRTKCVLHTSTEGGPNYRDYTCGLPRDLVCVKYVNGKCSEGVEECTKGCGKFTREWFACIGDSCMSFVPSCWICHQIERQCGDCPEMLDDSPDPDSIREKIRNKLRPTGRVDLAGKSGIFDVVTDGSLRGGGVELISTGRRPTFNTLYKMSKEMLESVKEEGAFLDERCGIHMHLLTGYYPTGSKHFANELERPMPQVILANLHQLVRRYQSALVWMTSCLSSKESMTRWEKFRIGIQDLSPMEVSMADLKKLQHSQCSNTGNGKYGFFSYSGKKLEEKTRFNSNGDVEIFHVEFRVPDTCWNPSVIASWAYMIYAMLIRAVDLSLYGVMEYAQSPEEAERLKEEYRAICNNCPNGWDGERVSKTHTAYRYFERYIEDSENLLEILKPVLLREEPVFGILKELAAKPISIRRIGGETFEDIEATMEKYVPKYHNDEILTKVDESIDLSIFTDCSSLDEWVDHVIDEAVKPTKKERSNVSKKLHEYIQEELDSDRMIWNETTGTLVTRR